MKLELKKRVEVAERSIECSVTVHVEKNEQFSLQLLELMQQALRSVVADSKVTS